MTSDGSPTVSPFSKRTEPERFSTIPMIDFRVVVLPAPLRPKSVTSSPRPISKFTPCRMWDSPYHACRPSTFKRLSGMTGPDIGFDDQRVLRHCFVRPLGQHFA